MEERGRWNGGACKFHFSVFSGAPSVVWAETLPKRVSDDPRHFIFRRLTFFFGEFLIEIFCATHIPPAFLGPQVGSVQSSDVGSLRKYIINFMYFLSDGVTLQQLHFRVLASLRKYICTFRVTASLSKSYISECWRHSGSTYGGRPLRDTYPRLGFWHNFLNKSAPVQAGIKF